MAHIDAHTQKFESTYLCNNIRHQRVQGDLVINMEMFEEASEAFKEFEVGVIARAYPIIQPALSGQA